MPTQILGLGGSLRAGSGTIMALNIALAGAEEQGARTRLMDLASLRLPLFNGSDGIDGYSSKEQAAITSLLDAVDEAQGVILGSPTYHNTISGSLKNALDFLEILREDGPSRFTGKIVGLTTVQGGASGTGNNTLTTMLLAARAMGAWVPPTMVSIPGGRDMFQEDSQHADSTTQLRLRTLGAEVARASEMFSAYWSSI
jgi:FMN reductase